MKDVKLSPSSINMYRRCPRAFYHVYIEGLKTPGSIHMVKGTVIHDSLDALFEKYTDDYDTRLFELIDKNWDKHRKELVELNVTDEELATHKKDANNIVNMFLTVFKQKMNMLLENGKASGSEHAFNLLRPKFRELRVSNDTLNIVGKIDRVHTDFDGLITLGDYKTSMKYGIGLSEEYKRQLAIYALLYYLDTKVIPNFVSIIFLRYGEEYLLEVNENLLNYAKKEIEDVRNKTKSENIEDYPKCTGRPCFVCEYLDITKPLKDEEDKRRLEELKKLGEDIVLD